MSKSQFPFTAVIGQDALKTALILCAIDPKIGGVLISGPRGCAKSTLTRALSDLQPSDQHPFVTLPLGASEEQLTGSLDLQQIVEQQQVRFNPGLLAKAHQGVLYVDEVNLLPDHLVDQLLDVAASGINRVERDGLSHQHPAEFVLAGTMNPDEGELRPQLKDRFGLAITLDGQYTPEQRVAIVRQRLTFDRDPEAFCTSYIEQTEQLRQQILNARNSLKNVTLSEASMLDIATRSASAMVEGLRADICWHRAASAHAAFHGRSEVSSGDIDATEELVLHHRRHPMPPQPQNQPQTQSPYQRPEQSKQVAGDWGQMSPQSTEQADTRRLPRQTLANTAFRISDTLSQQMMPGNQLSQATGTQENNQRPDWFRTFSASENQPQLQRLKLKRQRSAIQRCHLIALDTSASVLQGQGLAKARGLIQGIAEQAYLQREQLAILTFGNQQTEWLQPRCKAPKQIRPILDQIKAGGGTPLRQAVVQLAEQIEKLKRASDQPETTVYLITDGRSRDQLTGIELGTGLLIDTEQGAVKRGRGAELANQLAFQYLPLEQCLTTTN